MPDDDEDVSTPNQRRTNIQAMRTGPDQDDEDDEDETFEDFEGDEVVEEFVRDFLHLLPHPLLTHILPGNRC